MPIKLNLSPDTIMDVWNEWEQANPGKIASRDMPSNDFADAMIKKMVESAKVVRPDGGDPH